MAEGFFHPDQLAIPNLDVNRLMGAMVRILPKTLLVLDIAESAEAALELGRNESRPDGTECWYRFFTREDMARVHEPEFSMGMVRHEFSQLVKEGGSFPATVWLKGGGSGFCFDPRGLILTNYHLVTGEVASYQRGGPVLLTQKSCAKVYAPRLPAKMMQATGSGPPPQKCGWYPILLRTEPSGMTGRVVVIHAKTRPYCA